MNAFLQLAWRPEVRVRALKVALVVGTILVLINHINAILAGEVDAGRFFQMVLTYFVPYGVSTYSSVKAIQNS